MTASTSGGGQDGVLNREEFLGFFEDVFPLLQDLERKNSQQPATKKRGGPRLSKERGSV